MAVMCPPGRAQTPLGVGRRREVVLVNVSLGDAVQSAILLLMPAFPQLDFAFIGLNGPQRGIPVETIGREAIIGCLAAAASGHAQLKNASDSTFAALWTRSLALKKG